MTKKHKEIKVISLDSVDINTLIEDEDNARIHPDVQIKVLKEGMKKAFTMPILIDENNLIIAGHARLRAAKELGMKSVPCRQIINATERDKKEMAIRDNRLQDMSYFDNTILDIKLKELYDLGTDLKTIGFEDFNPFEQTFEPASEKEQGKLDELSPKIVTCPHCKKDFDINARD